MSHLRLVEPAPDITVHPTIVSAIGTMHTWMADHADARQQPRSSSRFRKQAAASA